MLSSDLVGSTGSPPLGRNKAGKAMPPRSWASFWPPPLVASEERGRCQEGSVSSLASRSHEDTRTLAGSVGNWCGEDPSLQVNP